MLDNRVVTVKGLGIPVPHIFEMILYLIIINQRMLKHTSIRFVRGFLLSSDL